MMQNSPIGLFDSGLGGTSIWKELHELLPGESTVYLADSRNAPYGAKSKAEIIRCSIKNTELLLTKGCKLIVVACNTATTNAIQLLRERYDVPFIGIEPAIKPASIKSKTKAVGILATQGTLSSALFHETAALYGNGIKIIEQDGKGLVKLIEAGKIDTEETRVLLEKYLAPMIQANVDHLVLGCSHYPYLIPAIKKILPDHIQIIDSGLAAARQTLSILKQKKLLSTLPKNAKHRFFSNADPEVLRSILGGEYPVEYLDF